MTSPHSSRARVSVDDGYAQAMRQAEKNMAFADEMAKTDPEAAQALARTTLKIASALTVSHQFAQAVIGERGRTSEARHTNPIDEAWNDGKLAGIDAGFWRGFAVGVVLALLASFAVWRALS